MLGLEVRVVPFVLAPGFAIVVLLFALLPFITLFAVANARGQSPAYVLWGFLSWTGVIIGLLIMIAVDRRPRV